MTEYTGQLVGGPDDGNLITATVPDFRCEVVYRQWLDGPDRPVSETIVRGTYVWDESASTFRWHR
jgi:hypothetical protein